MTRVTAAVRRRVISRAGNRCEYCGLSQVGQHATFHLDHILPVSAGGPNDMQNLALACAACSLHKGALTHAQDPDGPHRVLLYNPRTDRWSDHFTWHGLHLVGTTATGRATVAHLKMNSTLSLLVRTQEQLLGRHPPPMP